MCHVTKTHIPQQPLHIVGKVTCSEHGVISFLMKRLCKLQILQTHLLNIAYATYSRVILAPTNSIPLWRVTSFILYCIVLYCQYSELHWCQSDCSKFTVWSWCQVVSERYTRLNILCEINILKLPGARKVDSHVVFAYWYNWLNSATNGDVSHQLRLSRPSRDITVCSFCLLSQCRYIIFYVSCV